MGSAPPSVGCTPIASANAAAAAALGATFIGSSPANSLLVSEQANNLRLMAVYDRISLYLNGVARFETSDVVRLCYAFAKAIDYFLTLNDIPGIAPRLPPLVKKVYEWRKNAALQSAIMMILISIKNACRKGWFRTVDSEELLSMVNELSSKYCTDSCLSTHVNHAFETISKIMPRFYPRLMLHSVIVSFEAKSGYDVLMTDFHFTKSNHPEQKIVLIVVKTENLETSSCITSPPQVSFMVNGKGVEKRNNVSLDCGPLLPTDLSKMLKYGINILQTIGYFDGTYLIAIAFMGKMTNFRPPALKDYVQPVLAAHDSDSEIIEGPSRISLSCPISFTRMKTPVKGHLCKHHQCFDYANFLEMNSRKPNWRCPHCNQPVCMTDLRIDRSMVKILEEVGEDVTEVVIHANGSWNVVSEHGRCIDKLQDRAHVLGQIDRMDCEEKNSKISMVDPVDLTMDEDNCDLSETVRSAVSFDGFASQHYEHIFEAEDRKPFIDAGSIPLPSFFANSSSNAALYQLGSNIQSTFMPSYATNGSVASTGSLQIGSSQTLLPNLGNFFHSDNFSSLDQMQLSADDLQAISNVNERISGRSLPGHDDRAPVAVQALPVPQLTHNTSRRNHPTFLDIPINNLSPMQHQALNMSPSLENIGGIGSIDMQQTTRSAITSAIQDHNQLGQQYDINEAVPQQMVGLSSPNTFSGRQVFSHRRGPSDIDAFRVSHQPSTFSRSSIQMPPNFRAHPPSMSQPTNALSQSSSIPSAVRHSSQTVGLSPPNFGTQRSHGQPVISPRFLRALPTTPANLMPPSRDSSRAVSVDQWRSLTGGTTSPLLRADGLPELPSEQNWRPTGRMRGSLSGNDYSAVLSNYMARVNQPASSRPLTSPSTSDQVSVLIANNLLAHQANFSQDMLGTQEGDARI